MFKLLQTFSNLAYRIPLYVVTVLAKMDKIRRNMSWFIVSGKMLKYVTILKEGIGP